MSFLSGALRFLIRLALVALLALGVSWMLAGSALSRLDRVVAEADPDLPLPQAPLNMAQKAGLFLAAQVLPLHQPGQSQIAPGKVIQDCEDCPEIVVIPRGYYLIGSPIFESGRYQHILQRLHLRELRYANREGPRRLVTVANAIGVSRFQVTIAEWQAAQNDPQWKNWTGRDPRMPDFELEYSPRHPVTQVDWDDAQAYARYLSKKTGETYRLPTDAEWEYAARAGSVTRFPWGNDIGVDKATCLGCTTNQEDGVETPVGTHAPNAFGLFDMNGNGMEWTEDCFLPFHAALKVDASAHVVEGCQFRSTRGGEATQAPWQSRSAMRVGPHYYNDGRGLTIRLVREIQD